MAAVTAVGAAPVEYRFDPSHTFVHFEVRHFGTSTLRGRFGPIEGSVVLDREAGTGSLTVNVATAGVSSGVRVFDSRLREPDLLAATEFPQASFVADRFVFDAGRLAEVKGSLTLRGVRQPLTLRALRFACETREMLQREVCGGDFEAEFERSAFGIVFGSPFVADRVRLVIQVEGIRQ
ncbi:MAG: polyisoprenoid-binding protein [Piscinibacter sp.]|nr:polyisoprenoid-binding protein [Piscinibacter sp.]